MGNYKYFQAPDGTRLKFPSSASKEEIADVAAEYIKTHGVESGAPGFPKHPGVDPPPKPPQVQPESPMPTGDFLGDLTTEGPPSALGAAHRGLLAGGGGMLRTAEGVATLPFDIAAHFGNENAEQISNKLREIIPNIPAETTAQEIGQTLTQYGLPTAGVLKLFSGVLKGAPWAARFMSDLALGGAVDFAVSGPQEGSLGDFVGGPTQIDEQDTDLQRRMKIGVEGVAVPAMAAPVVATLRGVFKASRWLGRTVTDLMKAEDLGKTVVKKALRSAVRDPELTIKNIDEAMKLVEGTDFKPTLGMASGDVGLISFERKSQHLFTSTSDYSNRILNNQRAISDSLEEIKTGMKGMPSDLQEHYQRMLVEPIEKLQTQLDQLRYVQSRVQEETIDTLHSIRGELGTPGSGRTLADASEVIDDVTMSRLNALTTEKNIKYNAIDPENAVEIPRDRLKTAYEELIKKTSPQDYTPNKIKALPDNLEARIKAITQDKTIKKSGVLDPRTGEPLALTEKLPPLTFGGLQDLKPDLSAAIREARRANQGGVVERLVKFKEAIEAETDHLIATGSEAGQRAADAKAFYTDEFVPRFKEYVGDKYRQAVRSGKPIPPSDVGKRFLTPMSGSREAAAQLRIIIEDIPDQPKAQEAIRNYLVRTLAGQIDPKATPGANLKKLTKWMNNKSVSESLEQFPDVLREVEEFQKAIAKGDFQKSVLGGLITDTQNQLKLTERDFKRNAASWFVDQNPHQAMKKVLTSANPSKEMAELVRQAKGDPSGAAYEGLRYILADYLDDTLRGAATVTGGNFEVAFTKVNKLFKNKPQLDAIKKLYTPEEMRTLKQLHTHLEMMGRMDIKAEGWKIKDVTESLHRARVILASWIGIIKGRGVFMIGRWVQKMTGQDPVLVTEKILSEALLDPKLARAMLLPNTEAGAEASKVYVAKHLVNNMLAPREDEE